MIKQLEANRKMSLDKEIELLKKKRFIEMRKKILANQNENKVFGKEVDPLKVLSKIFTEKAWEVFNSAKQQYPGVVDRVAKDLAQLVLKGEITGAITGEQLLWLFRFLGINVRMETKIRFLEGGKLKTIAEKLREG